MDDIIIFIMDWEEHLQKLNEVLIRLKKAGLTLQPDKCLLGAEMCTYLGYKVGGGRVRPELSKNAAVQLKTCDQA